MVNPELIAAASELSSRKVLVTGASGFVGSHLARVLAASGHDVTRCGRNPYRVPFILNGTNFVRCDLTDRERTIELCREYDVVYHVGAFSSPWGNRKTFSSVNIDGTQNVVDGCLHHNVERMVHVSSTAVQFDFKDAYNVTESESLATPFACEYAWSKAEAETIVQRAVKLGLNGVVIRARAVFGPGDNSLLPRLLDAADRGRLRRLGKHEAQLDLTFIDNLVLALILAAHRGAPGRVYTITNGEPVSLWPFVKDILRQTGRSAELRTIPRAIALKAADFAERWHRWRGAEGEPTITRYAAGLLSTSKTFDISAAKCELRYEPIVSMTNGTVRTIAALTQRDDASATSSVSLRLFTTGYTSAKAHLVERGTSRTVTYRFHALIGVIEHPIHGLTLFDTGYAPRFFDATRRWPYRIYRWMTPVFTDQRLSAFEVLKSNGINPGDIRRIILSHFHADHVCGLIDFPHADIISRGRCWNAVRNRTGMGAVRRAFLPGLLPEDIEDRLFPIDQFHDPGFGPFSRSHDLFADGSVRVFDLPGHAAGQIGVLVQRSPDDRAFLVADSVWTSRIYRGNLKPTLPFRLLADSVRDVTTTQQRLHELHCRYPDIEIIPTHCPEVAARYGFDSCVDEVHASAPAVTDEGKRCAS